MGIKDEYMEDERYMVLLSDKVKLEKKLDEINRATLHAGCNGHPDCINCKIQHILNEKGN